MGKKKTVEAMDKCNLSFGNIYLITERWSVTSIEQGIDKSNH